MKFVNVTDKNFEDIFLVSAKYEQWQYVKHQIFDMVNNYAAVINREYLPIPFLVYENDNVIGFVQVNYFDRKNLFEICKLIVQETEQNKGYGKQILSEIIKWLRIRYGNGTIAANYKKSNSIADKLFSRSQFKKNVSEAEITAVMEINNRMTEELESEFEEIPYSTVDEFADKIKKSGKYPEEIVGNKYGINFRKINMKDCSKIIEFKLLENQEDYIMPFVDSLAESYSDLFEEEITVTYGLCNGEELVGLIEIRYVKGKDFPDLKDKMVYELFRILVDKEHQNKGYGTRGIKLFMDYVRKRPLGEANDIVLSVVEGNNVALSLYESFGFKIIGRDKYEHIAMKYVQ